MWTWPEFPVVAAFVVAVQLLTLALVVVVACLYVRAKARMIRRILKSTPQPFDPFETNPAGAEGLIQKLREASEKQ
jgi:hypothetical protein